MRSTLLLALGLLAVGWFGTGCGDAVGARDRSAMDTIPIVGQRLFVRRGFGVNVFAEQLEDRKSVV